MPGTILYNTPIHNYLSSRSRLIFRNEDTNGRVVNFNIHGVASGLNIRNPTDEDMEILSMYEVKIQLLWDLHDPSHSKNKNSPQLSQGVETRKHRLMMVDTNCEDGNISTQVNLAELWTMEPTMVKQFGRYQLVNKLDYSGDDSYLIFGSSDDDMDSIYGDSK